MSLFGDLYVGTSGLQSSQEALNVVAHNVTNTDTTGYVRQQVSYSTREYNTLSIDATGVSRKQTGLGVFISEVRQVRDRFVDQSYREESGRKGFYDISYGTVEEIEAILGELDGATFSDSMNDFWTAIEELVKDPSSEVCQSMLVQYAQSFSEAAQNVYSDMSNYQDKLNLKVKNGVDQINSMAHQIYQLNNQIRSIEAGGVENANDLKDERNLLLDQLSTLGKISYNEDFFGNILVKFEGHDLILGDRVNEMAYQATEDEGFYQVYWPDSAKSFIDADGEQIYDASTAPVFDLSVEISSAIDTDIGSLKAMLLARADHRGNYTDLKDDASYSKIESSIMMNVMAEFDGLVHTIVTAVNGVLAGAADPASGYMCDANGNPIQLFERISSDEYQYDETTATWNAVAENAADSSTWFSIKNLVVNEDLLQYPTHLGFVKPDGSTDYETAKALESAFEAKDYILNPKLTNQLSIREYYSNLVAQCANSGNVYKSLKENQDLTVESVETARQGSIGVSTDEELSNMIKFQNAYNANSRFINVIDECMEHIISTLGS